MVLCEAFSWADGTFKELKPCNTNFRNFAKNIFDLKPEEQPWFGIEQEYILNHGSELNKNISCYNRITTFRLVHTDGQTLVSQEIKDLTIAL